MAPILFLIPLCVEMLIVQFMLQFQIDLFTRDQHEFNYIFCVIQIAIYAVVLTLGKCKHIKKGDKVPSASSILCECSCCRHIND